MCIVDSKTTSFYFCGLRAVRPQRRCVQVRAQEAKAAAKKPDVGPKRGAAVSRLTTCSLDLSREEVARESTVTDRVERPEHAFREVVPKCLVELIPLVCVVVP